MENEIITKEIKQLYQENSKLKSDIYYCKHYILIKVTIIKYILYLQNMDNLQIKMMKYFNLKKMF